MARKNQEIGYNAAASCWLLGTPHCSLPVVARAAAAIRAVREGEPSYRDRATLNWLLDAGLSLRVGRRLRRPREVVLYRWLVQHGADAREWSEERRAEDGRKRPKIPHARLCDRCGVVFRPDRKGRAAVCADCHRRRAAHRGPSVRSCSACAADFMATDPRRKLCSPCRTGAAKTRRSREARAAS